MTLSVRWCPAGSSYTITGSIRLEKPCKVTKSNTTVPTQPHHQVPQLLLFGTLQPVSGVNHSASKRHFSCCPAWTCLVQLEAVKLQDFAGAKPKTLHGSQTGSSTLVPILPLGQVVFPCLTPREKFN